MLNESIGNLPDREFLTDRKRVLGAALAALCFSILSWRDILMYRSGTHHSAYLFGFHFPFALVPMLGFSYSILCCVWIAFRSPLRLDRFVFGLATISFCSSLLRESVRLGNLEMLASEVVNTLCWTIAAGICIVTLLHQLHNPISSD